MSFLMQRDVYKRQGDVAQDAPGQRGVVGQPLVLRHHAHHDAHGRKSVHGNGQVFLALDVVSLAPDVVQQHIEHRHGDSGDPLAQTQRPSVVLQAGGAQCQRCLLYTSRQRRGCL